MKSFRSVAVCISVLIYSLGSSAQTEKPPINEPNYNKPKLFDNLPDKIPVSPDEINSLLNAEIGHPASLKLSPDANIRFDGEVVSSASKYGNSIRSVVILSSNYPGARFTISKIISAEGLVSYTGRIISFQHGDVYELKNQAGQLLLLKRKFYDLVNE